MSALDQHHTHQGAVPFLDGPIKTCSLVIGHCTVVKPLKSACAAGYTCTALQRTQQEVRSLRNQSKQLV